MPINNITRNNTIDEWRIQTNESAGALNTVETGNYDKCSGTLTLSNTAVLSITSTGQSLQVSNGALFQTNVTIGQEIALGVSGAATGNLSMGGVLSVYGPGTSFYVANNVIANSNLVVKSTITTNNVVANSNVFVAGHGVIDKLRVNTNATIGTTLLVTGNTTTGNLVTSGRVYTGSLTSTGPAVVQDSLEVVSLIVDNDADITGKLTVSGDFVVLGTQSYDTDSIVLSSNSSRAASGNVHLGVFRGNTSGSIEGHNGDATNPDANAYIRWSASANNWQIRDIFNPDTSSAYSKILTANLISSGLSSTSCSTFLSSYGANTLYTCIQSESAERKANVGATSITLTNFLNTLSTSTIAEGSNLWFTAARVRANVSATSPIGYNSGTGVFSHCTSGVSATTYGNTCFIPVITVNSTGHVTGITNTAIAFPADTDTLASVTARGASTSDAVAFTNTTDATNIFNGGSVTISGGLAVACTLHACIICSSFGGQVVSSVYVPSGPLCAVKGAHIACISHCTSGVTAGTYGSSTSVPTVCVNNTGHVCGITTTSIPSASTITAGLVSLSDSISSVSTTTAATPNSVKCAYDLAAGKLSSITITNGTGVSGGGTGSAFTLSIGQAVGTGDCVRFYSLGVGVAASGTAGEIRACNDITAFYGSDRRWKTNISDITCALQKVDRIGGKTFDWTEDYIKEHGGEDGYFMRRDDFGVIAQDVQEVFPIAVRERDHGYLAVNYNKLVALSFAAIKELGQEVSLLKEEIKNLKGE